MVNYSTIVEAAAPMISNHAQQAGSLGTCTTMIANNPRVWANSSCIYCTNESLHATKRVFAEPRGNVKKKLTNANNCKTVAKPANGLPKPRGTTKSIATQYFSMPTRMQINDNKRLPNVEIDCRNSCGARKLIAKQCVSMLTIAKPLPNLESDCNAN